MTLISVGYSCDICGSCISGVSEKDPIYRVKIKGITKKIDCCYRCIELMRNPYLDWKKLLEKH